MEQNAHDVFSRIAEQEEPPLGFTADEIVTRGRRQVRVRRAGAVLSGAVGTLAVTAAVLPLASLGSGGQRAEPGAPGTAPTAPATSGAAGAFAEDCAADLAKAARTGGVLQGAQSTAALQACPVLKRVDAVLDPQGTHLWAASPDFQHSAPVDIINGPMEGGATSKISGIGSQISWTPDGHDPFKHNGVPETTGPYVRVLITIRAAGGSSDFASAPDHRDTGLHGNGAAAPGLPWGPATVTSLKDGSTVSLKKEQDSAGASAVATRTLPSGAQLILYIDGPYQEPGTNTLPFTDQQLVDAVNVSGVDDVALPIDSGMPAGGMSPSPSRR